MPKINTGHFLMGCRLDVWLRLLRENGFSIAKDRVPEALLITGVSTLLAPFALAEKLIYQKRIAAAVPARDPVYILGHWRSGTTYLQNMLAQDTQFAWADPVNTVLMPCSLLLGGALKKAVARGLEGGRPMDNVQYSLQSPMEETFALLTVSTHSVIDMLAFPAAWERYLSEAFLEDLPPEARQEWRRAYTYVIQKLTYAHGGRQLLLKSPDNTAHVAELHALYPEARFINIHRDPYETIRSTIHMFRSQMERQQLGPAPENLDEIIEDAVVEIFRRMYRSLFDSERLLPENRRADIAYTEFCARPTESLRAIYEQLELPGFEAARPAFEAYAAGQKNYVKNHFTLSPGLCRKINGSLGFYFERYGYEMREAAE